MILKSIFTLTVVLSLISISSVYGESSMYDVLDYDVGYDIENGEILVIDLDVDFTSMIIKLVAFDDGFIELETPRGLLDSTFDDIDDIFIVLIDGVESNYLEVDSDDSHRTLIIPFFLGDEEIDVIGTSVLTSDPDSIESSEETMDGAMMEKEAMDEQEGGGCLIATAAYGTELAPQVQFLREIRDNTVMSTSSGAAFMTGFNQLYYSFSPTIADMERENPVFKEIVKVFITPILSSLSIMTLAEEGSESQVLGLGLSVIALNLGMYVAAPALIGFKVHKYLRLTFKTTSE